jgi:hypothetical protein
LVLSAVVAAVVAQGEYAPPAYEKKYDGYFQYANVPSQHEYEFGYNRGNADHRRNHYEQSKDMRFRTKVCHLFDLIFAIVNNGNRMLGTGQVG